MIDGWGRTIDYLRISVTDRCELRCVYCMPAEGIAKAGHADMLTYEELLRLARLFAEAGIRKVKLTGGEPLCRRGLEELTAGLKAVPGIECVTLTTNGIELASRAEALRRAGLDAVNVSLDTLDPALYERLTRRPWLDRALAGLDAALAAGLPVKVNCVPAVPEQKLWDVAELARARVRAVRFIEMMPIGLGRNFSGPDRAAVIARLEERFGPLTPAAETLGNGPASYFAAAGFRGRLGFISAVSHRFCGECNRVRLTSEGYLLRCLQYDGGTDLRGPLRSGASDAALRALIGGAIAAKPDGHHFACAAETPPAAAGPDESRNMSQIGG